MCRSLFVSFRYVVIFKIFVAGKITIDDYYQMYQMLLVNVIWCW